MKPIKYRAWHKREKKMNKHPLCITCNPQNTRMLHTGKLTCYQTTERGVNIWLTLCVYCVSGKLTCYQTTERGVTFKRYTCSSCGRQWDAKDKVMLWPVHMRVVPKWAFTHWREHAGRYDIGSHLFVRVIRVGPLHITLGNRDYAWRRRRGQFYPKGKTA